MRALLLTAAVVLTVATTAIGARLAYSDWADGPVHHLMTKEELAEWSTITTDERAKSFVDLFWARRDPTPGTPRNEFREQFDARVAIADRQFSSPRKRGAMSDPGRVLILLGPPYHIGSQGLLNSKSSPPPAPGDVPLNADGTVALPTPTGTNPQQIWTYAHDHKPAFIAYPDFTMVFVDQGENDWELARTERINPQMILAQAVKALIVSPNLKQAPFASDAPGTKKMNFSDVTLKDAYYQFRATKENGVGPAHLTWGEFVTSDGDDYAAIQLYVPKGSGITAGQDVTFFSALEDETGNLADVREEPLKMIASGDDAYAEQSFHFLPGVYQATFGIASGGKILSARRTELRIEGLAASAAGTSPLILSNSITPLQTTWHPDDPFTFGGLKVVPKGDGRFAPAGNLWYFVEVRNPGLTPEKVPAMQVEVEISGTTAKGPAKTMRFPMTATEVAPLKGSKEHYAIGLAIPLENFQPGSYTIRVHVVDTVLSKKYDLEKPFEVIGL